MANELTREELFLLVWERPTREVARELGISDVALAKRCKKLQVPKPPRRPPKIPH
jgi:DNA-binding Lrp family transcriptional regulator